MLHNRHVVTTDH